MRLNYRCAVATILPMTLFTLTACSGDSAATKAGETAETTSTVSSESTSSEQPSTAPLSEIIVDASVAPVGFEYIPPAAEGEPSLAELLGAEDPEAGLPIDINTFNPPQCAGVHMDSLTVLDWMMEPTDTTATASYANPNNDNEAIFVKVTSSPADPETFPADMSECAEISRDMSGDGEQGTLHYAASPADFSVDGAEVLVAAHVLLTSASMSGIPLEAEGIGQGFHLVTATVDDLTFTIAAADTLAVDAVSTIAHEQAARIAAARS